MESYETCDISDYTWSLMYLFRRHEKGKIRRPSGTVRISTQAWVQFLKISADYNISPAQIRLSQIINPTIIFFIREANGCLIAPIRERNACPGNVNRFLPNYVLNMWKKDGNAVYAALYGASTFETDGIYIQEDTDYPFREAFRLIYKRKSLSTSVPHSRLGR